MVLSGTGMVTRYLYGVTFLPFDVKMAVTEAAQGRTGPTIARLLKFCFNYDPAGRPLFASPSRGSPAAFTIVLAVGFGRCGGRHAPSGGANPIQRKSS